MALRRIEDALMMAFRRRESHLATYARGVGLRVEGRNADGTLALRAMDGECVATAGACSSYVGQIIDIPCSPPLRMVGAAGVPLASVRRNANALWVESIDPSFYTAGSSVTVTITGRGFRSITVFQFLLPGTLTVNPYITITDTRIISKTEAEVDITVDPSAPPIEADTGDLAYDSPGTPL